MHLLPVIFFQMNLNGLILLQFIKKMIKPINQTTDQLVFYLQYQKFLKNLFLGSLAHFWKKKLSKFLCGFRKKYSTQHALINLINKWYCKLDSSSNVGAVLMDLSKAYDTLPHDLLIAKLAAYGLGNKSLSFLLSYLSNRKQRVKNRIISK